LNERINVVDGEFMENAEELKRLVREKYGEIARSPVGTDCCGASCCGVAETTASDYTIFADDYTKLDGYNPDADLKLGCGIPTEHAKIKEGDTVVDLGSGAGNDAFVARAIVGERGKVIGLDMTEPMIEKARQNAEKLGHKNVEFKLGEIEDMPLDDATADVVVSNCVLNLVPNKKKAFAEIFRILKPGAHFSISDVVLVKPLPEGLQKAAEMYAGCVAGAILKDEYLRIITDHGFENVHVQMEKPIAVPDDVLVKYLSETELTSLKARGSLILSVTVYGEKPHAG
jgi:arsenite methyltransferase